MMNPLISLFICYDDIIELILLWSDNMCQYAIEELMDLYGRKVFNLALRLTGNRPDAEDVMQETFMQVYEKLDDFKGECAIYTWIYRIALNNCLKSKKRFDKAYVEALDEKIELFSHDIPQKVQQWYADPEKATYITQLLTEIRQGCLHFISFRLPDNQRIVYILRNVMDFSYNEISGMLRIDQNVIKARLVRARANLVKYFGGRCQWLAECPTCSCHSRIGFALAMDPEILKRVEAQAVGAGIIAENSAHTVYKQNIDDLYRKLPMLEYTPCKLEKIS